MAGKLEEEGFYPRLTVRKNAESYRDVLNGLAAQGVRRAVVAALDPESLEETASLLEAEDSLSACVGALYGRGSTLAVLNGLDRGTIRGICVTDEFSAGISEHLAGGGGGKGPSGKGAGGSGKLLYRKRRPADIKI